MEKNNNDIVKVIHIVGKMDMGGQETFIMNLYRNIDRNKIQFDFIVHSKEKGYYDDEIEKLGGKIYRITPLSKNIFKHILELYKVLKVNNKYILHRHTCSSIIAIDLLVAKLAKIKKRIVHSHATKSSTHEVANKIFMFLMNKLATDKLACSNEAGKFLYGEKSKFKVIHNSIELEQFEFNEQTREEVRKEHKCKDKYVIGHVGRFDEAKNHKFILELMEQIVKKNSNVELWLIGDGELRKEIEEDAENKKIKQYIKFMGTQKNVNRLLMAMDVFIFPSIYEGLGIALIEAQCTGLNCVVSNQIPNEAIITNNVKKLDIKEEKEIWIKEILREPKEKRIIDMDEEKIRQYGINNLLKEMKDVYMN